MPRERAESAIAFTDLPQGPVYRFSHEVSIIRGVLDNQSKKGKKFFIGGRFVVNGESGHHHKAGASDKFFRIRGPRPGFFPSIGCLVKHICAGLVADIPRIKRSRPAIHLARCDEAWFFDETGQQPSLVYSCSPEFAGQLVVGADHFGASAKFNDGDA